MNRLHELQSLIDANKTNISSGDYLRLCNLCKEMSEVKDKEPYIVTYCYNGFNYSIENLDSEGEWQCTFQQTQIMVLLNREMVEFMNRQLSSLRPFISVTAFMDKFGDEFEELNPFTAFKEHETYFKIGGKRVLITATILDLKKAT